MFGRPNDEAFHGHPLYSRGLRPYSVFEIDNSSWLRRLEEMNSVHEHHDKEKFLSAYYHFIFAFHDSTFECIADGFDYKSVDGSIAAVMAQELGSLG